MVDGYWTDDCQFHVEISRAVEFRALLVMQSICVAYEILRFREVVLVTPALNAGGSRAYHSIVDC